MGMVAAIVAEHVRGKCLDNYYVYMASSVIEETYYIGGKQEMKSWHSSYIMQVIRNVTCPDCGANPGYECNTSEKRCHGARLQAASSQGIKVP